MKQANFIPKYFQPKPGPMQKMNRSRLARATAAIFVAAMPLVGTIGCATPGKKAPAVELTQSGREIVILNVEQIKNEYLEAENHNESDAKTAVQRLMEIFGSYADKAVRDKIIDAMAAIRAAAIAAGDTKTAQDASAFLTEQGFVPQ